MKLAYCEGALLDNRETKNMQVKKIIAVCSNNNIMQAPEKMRVIPILKPDQESHQKWLDMTVQVRRWCFLLVKRNEYFLGTIFSSEEAIYFMPPCTSYVVVLYFES